MGCVTLLAFVPIVPDCHDTQNNAQMIWDLQQTTRNDPRRVFVFGFSVVGTSVRIWRTDRSYITITATLCQIWVPQEKSPQKTEERFQTLLVITQKWLCCPPSAPTSLTAFRSRGCYRKHKETCAHKDKEDSSLRGIDDKGATAEQRQFLALYSRPHSTQFKSRLCL